MNRDKEPSKATFDHVPGMTGRDGAIDLAARADAVGPAADLDASEQDARFTHVLGAAVVSLWSELPQPIQEQLFECAVLVGHKSERDEMLREQLAKFLHDHHKRTVGNHD